MGMTGTFFCVVLGAIALDEYAKRSIASMRHWVALAWMGVALAMTLPRFDAERKKYTSYRPQPPPVPQSDIDTVLQHTQPGDTIFAADDPLLCVYSDRVNAFRGGIVLDEIIEYYPGKTDEERLTVIREGLEEKRPKLVILGRNMVGPHRKRRYMRALVTPFIRDGGYIQLSGRFYLRPD
jgi:hypothetical protein